MAITLKADNRQLTKNAKFSYLGANYASGKTSVTLVNSTGFAADDYVLFGEFGNETTEIMQISSVSPSTHTASLTAATKFAHPESTKITIIPYNTVKFYYTTTATYSTGTPLTGYIPVQADDFYTKYADTNESRTNPPTGFGWFLFYNETTTRGTTNSNAIPYGDFSINSVKKVFDSFFSLLNNNELKLISNADAFRWLNEAYSIATNELNLVNRDYNVADKATISVVAGTKEYSLPSDFSDLISVTHAVTNVGADYGDLNIDFIYLKDVPNWDSESEQSLKYYIRGSYIGFSPTPTSNGTVYLYYNKKATTLTSYYDNIELPDTEFYILIDFMMYRAIQKLQKPGAEKSLELFKAGLDRMKVTSIKRDANLDTWGIADSANV